MSIIFCISLTHTHEQSYSEITFSSPVSMVFTGDKQNAEQILEAELTVQERQNVIVSTSADDLRQFVSF